METSKATQITIRQGHFNDLEALRQLFVGTISQICKADYNDDQISTWASGIENKKRWLDLFAKQYVLVAQDKAKIAGFCTLEKGCYIDFFYIHKDYQRQGIAKKLYAAIEKEARRQKQTAITADISITARPFFEKVGFSLVKAQSVVQQGIELTNFKMRKQLTHL